MQQVTIATEDALTQELKTVIGINLRRYRRLAKLKQETVAHEVGYASHSSITNIENGTMLPSLPQLVALARVVRAPLDGLIAKRPLEEEKGREIAGLAQRLPPDAQQALIAFLLAV